MGKDKRRNKINSLSLLANLYKLYSIIESGIYPRNLASNPKNRGVRNSEIILEIEGNSKELKRWILSYGKHAKVLELKEFREMVKNELKESLKNCE
jgi:predicted DNA-binding transcriptional regulator YafY